MKTVLSLVLMGIFGLSAFAQGTGQILGRKNPEKIPDALAYFMYFNHVGYALDNEGKDPTMAALLLQGTGLNEVEQATLKQIVIAHRIKQTTLENKRNSDVMAGTETAESLTAYRAARMKCTMDAVNFLLSQVSAEGAVAFKKFIQASKANLSMDAGTEKEWGN